MIIQAILAALAVASPTTAGPTSPLKPGQPYINAPSGIMIADQPKLRRTYHEYRPGALDVSIRFDDDTIGDFTTIYVFKRTNGDASVWLDRIEETLRARFEKDGEVKPTGPARASAFAAAQGTPVLRRTYALNGLDLSATGAAILANQDFYVSIRASSYRGGTAEVDRMIDRALGAIQFPADMPPVTTVPLTPCVAPLAPPAEAAPITPDGAAIVLASALDATRGTDGTPVPTSGYCSESDDQANLGIYRLIGTTDSYLLAYGDNGEAASVAASLPLDDGNAPFVIRLHSVSAVKGAAFYRSLPSPQQVIRAINAGTGLYQVTFKPDGDTEIMISEDLLK